MVFFKNKYFLLFLLFLLMLIDGQLSYLMSSIFSYHVTISSHLLLLAIINFYHDRNKHFVLFSALILGILYDIYYLNRIGLVVFLLPVLIIFTNKITKSIFASNFQTLTYYIIILFLFEIVGESAAVLLGMTTLSIANFIAYSFAPTLIFNVLLYLIFQKLFKKVYFNA